jgi:hypothetical protein
MVYNGGLETYENSRFDPKSHLAKPRGEAVIPA